MEVLRRVSSVPDRGLPASGHNAHAGGWGFGFLAEHLLLARIVVLFQMIMTPDPPSCAPSGVSLQALFHLAAVKTAIHVSLLFQPVLLWVNRAAARFYERSRWIIGARQSSLGQQGDTDEGRRFVGEKPATAGIRRMFSLSGNQIMPVYDACIDAGIEIVHTRHEAAAVFMADAWAQLTGEIGVALVTAGPGAMNSVGPLYTARQFESPVLLLTGDTSRAEDGKGAFQELDQIAITGVLTKRALRVGTATTFGSDLAEAIRTALSGRPGPVHVALPFDLLNEQLRDVTPPGAKEFRPTPDIPNSGNLAMLAEAIAAAAKPLILLGPALNKTRFGTRIKALSAALDAPAVPMEHPRGLKDPALGDFPKVLAEADLVISLGKPIDFMLGFGKPVAAHCRWLIRGLDGRREVGQRAAIDTVRGGDDPALRGLAEDVGEAGDRQPAAVDQVGEYLTGPDRGKLVDVADWRCCKSHIGGKPYFIS
jgi:hypothetical protein